MDDSADFFSELLQQLILLTDDSTTIDAKQRTLELDGAQQKRNEDPDGRQPDLEADVMPRYIAYCSRGKESPMLGSFCIQTTKEWQCKDESCGRVARSFEHSEQLLLSFPAQALPYTLTELLGHWAKEEVDGALQCPFLPNFHQPDNVVRKKITICPEYLMIQFGRHAGTYLNFVDIPEYLDLTPYADDAELPSEMETGKRCRTSKYCIYRLIAVNVYIASGLHYVAYVKDSLDGNTWVYLDDNPMYARGGIAQHPQAAMNAGHIPYYVIYEKVKGKKTLPLDDETKQPTSGHVLVRNATVPSPKCKDYSWARTARHPCPAMDSHGCTLWFDSEAEATDHSITMHLNKDTAGLLDGGSVEHPCPATDTHTCTKMFGTKQQANDHAAAEHYQDNNFEQAPLVVSGNLMSENGSKDGQNAAQPGLGGFEEQLKQIREAMAAAELAHENRRQEEQQWAAAHEKRRQEVAQWRAAADAAHNERERQSLLREKQQIAHQREILAAREIEIDEELARMEKQ